MSRGWWNMACWNGLSDDQQNRLLAQGNLPIGYEPEGNGCDLSQRGWEVDTGKWVRAA